MFSNKKIISVILIFLLSFSGNSVLGNQLVVYPANKNSSASAPHIETFRGGERKFRSRPFSKKKLNFKKVAAKNGKQNKQHRFFDPIGGTILLVLCCVIVAALMFGILIYLVQLCGLTWLL